MSVCPEDTGLLSDQSVNRGMMLTTKRTFGLYEEVGARLPKVSAVTRSQDLGPLLDIANQNNAVISDAFGPLNIGEPLIHGKINRLTPQLRAGIQP